MLLRFKILLEKEHKIAKPKRLTFLDSPGEALPESKNEKPLALKKSPSTEKESEEALKRLKAKKEEIKAALSHWGSKLHQLAQEIAANNTSNAISSVKPNDQDIGKTYAPQNFPTAQTIALASISAPKNGSLHESGEKASKGNQNKLILQEKTSLTAPEFEKILLQEPDPEKRKKIVQENAEKGNISFGGWSKITLDPIKLADDADGKEATVEIKVTNRFIGIGQEGYLPPVDGPTAKYLAAAADQGKGLMPTPKVVQAIIKNAKAKNSINPLTTGPQLAAILAQNKNLDPKTREAFANWANDPHHPPGKLMISPLTKSVQNKIIAGWLKVVKRGTLTDGYLKTVGINPQMQDEGTTKSGIPLKSSLCLIGALNEKGAMIQLGTGNPHNREHDDYSQGARAVGSIATLKINGIKHFVHTQELMNNGTKGDGWLTTLDGKKIYADGIYQAFADRPIDYDKIYADIKPKMRKKITQPKADQAVASAKLSNPPKNPQQEAVTDLNPSRKEPQAVDNLDATPNPKKPAPQNPSFFKEPEYPISLAPKKANFQEISSKTPSQVATNESIHSAQSGYLEIPPAAASVAQKASISTKTPLQTPESSSETNEKLIPTEKYYRIGDSLTLGYSMHLNKNFAHTFKFQENPDHTNINSMSGKPLQWIESRFKREILPQMKEGSCIAILGGTNDLFNHDLNDDDEVKTVYEKMTGHLKSIYSLAHQKGMFVVAATIPPLGEEFKKRFGKNGSKKYEYYIKLWEMVNAFILKGDSSQASSEKPDKVVPLHKLMSDNTYPENMNAIFSNRNDKIHPNNRGYKFMAEQIETAVAEKQREANGSRASVREEFLSS